MFEKTGLGLAGALGVKLVTRILYQFFIVNYSLLIIYLCLKIFLQDLVF